MNSKSINKNVISSGRLPLPLIAEIPAPPSVWSFAAENGLLSDLELAVDLAQKRFSNIHRLSFELVIDPENAKDSWINLVLHVSGTIGKVLSSLEQFDKEIGPLITPDHSSKICLVIGDLN